MAAQGAPAPGVAPSRADDGCHGAGSGPPPQRAAGGGAERGVEGETNDAPRRPKPPLPGKRPVVLLDPEPVQVVDAVTSYVAAPGPSSLVPRLAANDALDNATLKFLVARALLDRREQEEERRKREEEVKKRKKALLERLTAEGRRELEERLDSGGASSKRKRKKRRKRRTPRTSSLPSRARRRQRQWSACSAGFTGDDIPCVMFPSGVARPKMLDIMAGLVQMDSYIGTARLVLLVTLHLPLCFLHCLQARDARHHGRCGPEGTIRLAVQKTADVHSSSQVVDFLLRCRGLFHGLAVQQTIEFPQLLRYMWSMSLLCRSCSFPGGLQFSDTLMTCPLLREVQRDLRVHGSSCGTCRDFLHSPFDRKHHRCHCSCRDFVLFVGRRP